MSPGLLPGRFGRRNVLALHPLSRTRPGFITADLNVPDAEHPRLLIDVTSHELGDFVFKILVNGELAQETLVSGKGEWQTEEIDLTPQAGKKVHVRLEVYSNDWKFEMAYFDKVEIK
jgi:hypothetical protein